MTPNNELQEYISPEIEIIEFEAEDIIVTSCTAFDYPDPNAFTEWQQ